MLARRSKNHLWRQNLAQIPHPPNKKKRRLCDQTPALTKLCQYHVATT